MSNQNFNLLKSRSEHEKYSYESSIKFKNEQIETLESQNKRKTLEHDEELKNLKLDFQMERRDEKCICLTTYRIAALTHEFKEEIAEIKKTCKENIEQMSMKISSENLARKEAEETCLKMRIENEQGRLEISQLNTKLKHSEEDLVQEIKKNEDLYAKSLLLTSENVSLKSEIVNLKTEIVNHKSSLQNIKSDLENSENKKLELQKKNEQLLQEKMEASNVYEEILLKYRDISKEFDQSTSDIREMNGSIIQVSEM